MRYLLGRKLETIGCIFFDNPDIADKYGFITCYKGEPIGFICWDPRNRPEYVEIGHNGIKQNIKEKDLGKLS